MHTCGRQKTDFEVLVTQIHTLFVNHKVVSTILFLILFDSFSYCGNCYTSLTDASPCPITSLLLGEEGRYLFKRLHIYDVTNRKFYLFATVSTIRKQVKKNKELYCGDCSQHTCLPTFSSIVLDELLHLLCINFSIWTKIIFWVSPFSFWFKFSCCESPNCCVCRKTPIFQFRWTLN